MVQALCECWLVSGGPGLGELAGRELAVGAVGSLHVVVDSPVLIAALDPLVPKVDEGPGEDVG